jgi:hypothetical protein
MFVMFTILDYQQLGNQLRRNCAHLMECMSTLASLATQNRRHGRVVLKGREVTAGIHEMGYVAKRARLEMRKQKQPSACNTII